ncbi:HAMP domain-containing sensor histidine kinase [Gordonia sp. ABSL1-1]|uniref:sensor histidine kinase n=1 Tax=Gordonia sp. ABSL1-1 TaxID=3053923 RepID=UPI0025744ACB|nr:HAMP domain-containing sensor histidine kinase [Gordonia sp. ABSL1-1]MDL9937694.1 HAMP domain-containing sensor histidine kinase [Gordonia sp. ABSL1-1]
MRTRLTLIATALVTCALLVAGTVLVLVLHSVLLRTADGANSARANEVAAALADSSPAGVDEALFNTDQNVDLVQILNGNGQVVRTSRSRAGAGLGGPLPPGTHVVVDGAQAAPSDAEYRARRVGVRDVGGNDVVVEVGTAEEGINHLVLVVAALCAAVFPMIVLAMAVLTYVFVGRALAPVERIRRRVAEISDADLAERVPVPATDDELETLAHTMNAMLARLEAAQSAQRRFVGDASHELNSPLTSIYGLLDLARQTDTAIDMDTVRTLLLPEAERMRRLVADLSVLARADEGRPPRPHAAVALDDLVAAEIQRLRAAGGVVVEGGTVPATVQGDPGQLSRVIRNLTDNAARYLDECLSVTMSVTDTRVTVSVTDDGPGIPEADRERVFDRFVRLDPARARSGGGSGLGLAIVAEIVAAHNGTVGVESGSGGGARFWFTLPLARSDSRRL